MDMDVTQDAQSLRDAGHAAFKLINTFFAVGNINAREFCTICYWLGHAHTPGVDWKNFSQPPGLQSGRYQQFLNSRLPGPGPTDLVRVPVNLSSSPKRGPKQITCSLAYETLAEEIRNTPDLLQMSANTAWPPIYYRHQLLLEVRANGEPDPLPLALYSDGVRFTSAISGRGDSVTGFWLINLTTGKRHFVATITGQQMCRCGCKGHCTVYPVLTFLAWLAQTLKSGKRPLHRYDRS